MARRTARGPITSDASLAQAQRSSAALTQLLQEHHGGHHGMESLREDHYKGHHIVIKTSYDVTVDGQHFDAALAVSNSGDVEYHGMPNVGFVSAIDLMRSVIDQFPEDFNAPNRPAPPEHDHSIHAHSVDRTASTGTRATARKTRTGGTTGPAGAKATREPKGKERAKGTKRATATRTIHSKTARRG